MAVVSVPQSAANCVSGSALYELAVIVNAIAASLDALTAKMDTDFTAQNGAVSGSQLDTDYGTDTNTISFRETGAPS
jgi:hypothetical protein